MRLPFFLTLTLVAACAAQEPEIMPPPQGTPVIVISQGTSEWGSDSTDIYQNDLVVTTMSGGIGRPVQRSASEVPGAYARVAALLAREGPRAVRRQGGAAELCPGSVDVVAANPPVGRFEFINAPCGGDDSIFRALARAAHGAIRPPG